MQIKIALFIGFFLSWAGSSFAENLTNSMSQAAPAPVQSVQESQKILKQFKKAQKLQYKGLEHRQSAEMKELKAAQRLRYQEWRDHEKVERRIFFKVNPEGAERRKYIKDFIARRDALLSFFSQEKKERVREQEARRKAIHEDQVLKQKQFEATLKQGVRPENSLWPQPGGY